jgi:hypothetical protein
VPCQHAKGNATAHASALKGASEAALLLDHRGLSRDAYYNVVRDSGVMYTARVASLARLGGYTKPRRSEIFDQRPPGRSLIELGSIAPS